MTLRLRDTVAEAVADSLAGVIHDTMQGLLRQLTPAVPAPESSNWAATPTEPWWDDAEDHLPDEIDEVDWTAPHDRFIANAGRDIDSSQRQVTPDSAPAHRWRWPLMLGCQMTAWCLQRKNVPSSTFNVVGIGLITTISAYLVGPSLLAGLRLLGLADALYSSTAALAALSMS